MAEPVNDAALNALFREARTFSKWLPQAVPDQTLRDLYDLLKWGPTSANGSPARFVFLRSQDAKERLRPALATTNVAKVMTAPVTVIVAYDVKFNDHLPKLFPHGTSMARLFQDSAELAESTARRNSSLQGAYLIMAARALGLDCGPMSGFNQAKVDEEFFPEGHVKSNFICNLGYGDRTTLSPRLPRLSFEEACSLL